MGKFSRSLYKIKRIDLPGNHILLQGRMLGSLSLTLIYYCVGAMPLVIFALHKHYQLIILYCLLSAAVVLSAPFSRRFKIEISPDFMIIKIKEFGYTVMHVDAPFGNIRFEHNDLRKINEDSYKEYSNNPKDSLRFYYDNGWDSPGDFISMDYKGKDYRISTEQYPFDAELWAHLAAALGDIYKIKGML